MLFRSEGNGSGSFGGTWSGGLSGAKAGVAFANIFGGTAEASVLSRNGYIDINYYAPDGETVSEASILDSAPEFTLSGSAVADAVIDRVEKLSSTRYRYHYKDSDKSNTTPMFTAGTLQVQFAAGSWSTDSGATSPAAQLSATIRDGAGKANSTSSVKRGPLSISGPKISIEDIKFNLKPATDGGLPDTAGEDAAEGTRAHEVAAWLLRIEQGGNDGGDIAGQSQVVFIDQGTTSGSSGATSFASSRKAIRSLADTAT